MDWAGLGPVDRSGPERTGVDSVDWRQSVGFSSSSKSGPLIKMSYTTEETETETEKCMGGQNTQCPEPHLSQLKKQKQKNVFITAQGACPKRASEVKVF